MPKYHVTVRIIEDWSHVFEAEHEQAARNMAYDECEPDIGPGQYVEMDSYEIE